MIKEMIYDIEQSSIESELAVVESMMAAYDKMDLIMENTDTQIMDCSIFQEGKIMDDVKEQGVGQSGFQRFLTFIPRLIKALFNAITRLFDTKPDTKASSKKDNTKVKDIKTPKDAQKEDNSSEDEITTTKKKSLPESIKAKIDKILKSDKPKKEKKNALANALLTAADTTGALALGTVAVGAGALVGVGTFAAKGVAGAVAKGKQNRDSEKAKERAQSTIESLAEEIIDSHDDRMEKLNKDYEDVKASLRLMKFNVSDTGERYFVKYSDSTGKRVLTFNIYAYIKEINDLLGFVDKFVDDLQNNAMQYGSADLTGRINEFLDKVGRTLDTPLEGHIDRLSAEFKKINKSVSVHLDNITKNIKDKGHEVERADVMIQNDLHVLLNKYLPCAILNLNKLITLQENVEALDTSLFGDSRSSGFIMNSFSSANKGARVKDISNHQHKKIEDKLTKPKSKPATNSTTDSTSESDSTTDSTSEP